MDTKKKIEKSTGGIVIGDRALIMKERFKYAYDIAEAWFRFTGHPAVFAVWVANKQIDNKILQNFNKSLEFGVSNMSDVIKTYSTRYKYFNLENYLINCIDYQLDEKKLKSIDIYGEYLKKL